MQVKDQNISIMQDKFSNRMEYTTPCPSKKTDSKDRRIKQIRKNSLMRKNKRIRQGRLFKQVNSRDKMVLKMTRLLMKKYSINLKTVKNNKLTKYPRISSRLKW